MKAITIWIGIILLVLALLIPGVALAGDGNLQGVPVVFKLAVSNPDGDPLTYSATGLPQGATFDPDTCIFSWTPNYAQAGVYVVRFTVTDGELSDSVDVTITVRQPYPAWDVNWDGKTNILDLITVVQLFGETGEVGWSKVDVNDDGAINILDLIIISNHF